jgi:hypothetical protein
MEGNPRERVMDPVGEAWALLEAGHPQEAALLFGRVLLQEPALEEARRGLVQARARAGEVERELEARLEEARNAAAAGDAARARALLDDVIRLGGDRDRAHDLLDRLDERGGMVALAAQAPPPAPALAAAAAAERGRAWRSRTAFATACGVAFAALTTTVAASWDHLMGRLERRPLPAAYAASVVPLPAPPAGERALSEARRRLEKGDVNGALASLKNIGPDDPVYPFALQLRARAEGASRGGSGQGPAAR